MYFNNDENHIYLDCLTSNIDSAPNIKSQFLTFVEMRDNPILNNCSEYDLSIVRFQLSTANLPVMIFPVQLGQTDVNKGTYSITLKYKAFEYQSFISFVSPNKNESVLPPIVNQDFSNSYYEIYSYQYFINLVNTTFSNAFNGLKALVIAGGDNLPSIYTPYFDWGVDTGTATLNADISGYNLNLTNPIQIYMNIGLFTLFSSFDALYYGTNGITNGKNYQFNVLVNPNNSNILTFGNSFIPGETVISYIQCYQEFPTLAELGQAIKSVLFTTSLIPVAGSLQSKPTLFNANSFSSQQTQNNTVINMITDITVDSSVFSGFKPSLIYNANPYRLIPLQGNAVLRSYDISVFYKDCYGNIKPFLLSAGGTSTIKIMFRKKNKGY